MAQKSNPFRSLAELLLEAMKQANACESRDSVKQVERSKKKRSKDRAERSLRLQRLVSEARQVAARSSRLEAVDVEHVLELTRRCQSQIDGWFPAYGADGQLTEASESKFVDSQELYRPAVEELSRIADWLEGSESALRLKAGAKKRRGCPLRIKGKSVYVEEICVPLSMTGDRKEDAVLFLQYLINSNGDWISGAEINKEEEKKPSRGRSGVRWDRIKNQLPDAIRKHIQTSRKKGHCISWRK